MNSKNINNIEFFNYTLSHPMGESTQYFFLQGFWSYVLKYETYW